METIINSTPPPVEKTISELYVFVTATDNWLKSNQNHPNTDVGKSYFAIYPQIQAAMAPMGELKIRHEKMVRDLRIKHADSIKESEFSDRPNTVVTEFVYNSKTVVKRNWLGIKIGSKTDNSYSKMKFDLINVNQEIDKERHRLMNAKVTITPVYAKTIPNHQVLNTETLKIMKGLIIAPDFDKEGILRDVRK